MKGRIKYQFAGVLLSTLLLNGITPGFTAPSSSPQSSSPQKSAPPASPYNVSGPFYSDNLAVYLIKGPEKIKGQQILTLEEGLANKLVKVEETSDVNELRIKNLSNSVVFLQSGDIVRGGKQDRAIQYDMMLSPKSNKALPVFCVEHGRWQQRGTESASGFTSSSNQLSGKDLKLAAKKIGDQGSVWNYVSQVQGKLSRQVGNAQAAPSPSSFELTMDNNNVKAATKTHIDKLSTIGRNQNDVVGFAFAINGKINSADVYASNQLFQKLYPKLLKSAAAEAVAESSKAGATPKTTQPPPKPEEVQKFLANAESKPTVHKAGDNSFEMTEQESSTSLLYKTKWYTPPRKIDLLNSRPIVQDSRDVHVNYINK